MIIKECYVSKNGISCFTDINTMHNIKDINYMKNINLDNKIFFSFKKNFLFYITMRLGEIIIKDFLINKHSLLNVTSKDNDLLTLISFS